MGWSAHFGRSLLFLYFLKLRYNNFQNIRKLSTMNPDPGLATSDMSEVSIILEWLEVLMIVHVGPLFEWRVMCVGRSTLVGPSRTDGTAENWSVPKNPKKRSARSKNLRSVRTSNYSSYILTLVRILEVLGPLLRLVSVSQSVRQSVRSQVLFYFFLFTLKAFLRC